MSKFDPWKNKKTYKLFNRQVHIIKARNSDPVKWYTELHTSDDLYIASRGSNMPTEFLAVIETIIRGQS